MREIGGLDMSYSHHTVVRNGDAFTTLKKFTCDNCHIKICESDRHHQVGDEHLCIECSYLTGKITEDLYLEWSGFSTAIFGAEIIDGKPVIYNGKKPSEKTDKDYRANKQYKDWRRFVFERDNYTCRHCLKRGGELNAHHIKRFNKFIELRYEVGNGLTLCVACHRKVHKKEGD